MPSSKHFACDAETHTGGTTEDGMTTRKQVVDLGVFFFVFSCLLSLPYLFLFCFLSLFFSSLCFDLISLSPIIERNRDMCITDVLRSVDDVAAI